MVFGLGRWVWLTCSSCAGRDDDGVGEDGCGGEVAIAVWLFVGGSLSAVEEDVGWGGLFALLSADARDCRGDFGDGDDVPCPWFRGDDGSSRRRGSFGVDCSVSCDGRSSDSGRCRCCRIGLDESGC